MAAGLDVSRILKGFDNFKPLLHEVLGMLLERLEAIHDDIEFGKLFVEQGATVFVFGIMPFLSLATVELPLTELFRKFGNEGSACCSGRSSNSLYELCQL